MPRREPVRSFVVRLYEDEHGEILEFIDELPVSRGRTFGLSAAFIDAMLEHIARRKRRAGAASSSTTQDAVMLGPAKPTPHSTPVRTPRDDAGDAFSGLDF